MLAGSLSDFSIDDIFQLFALTKKSGALQVRTSDAEARVHFTAGDVIFAVADVRRMALGARLVGAGVLTEEQLRAIAASRTGKTALEFAVALLTSDVVDPSIVTDFLRDDIHESVSRLLRLDDGQFTFDNAVGVSDWPGPSFTSSDLLVEGRRRLQEWESISAQVPSLDVPLSLVPTFADGQDSATVTREQWQTLALIDGRRTATDLVDLTGKGEFATCKLLAALINSGLVEVRPAQGRTALEELLAGREALRKLEDVDLEASDGSPTEAPQVAASEDDGASAQADNPDEATAGDPEPADSGSDDGSDDSATDEASEDSAVEEANADEGDAEEAEATAADGDDSSDDDDSSEPPSRRDVNVDRVQMARELASLGFGEQAPLRRTVNRAEAVPAEANTATAAAEEPDARPEAHAAGAETMVEHRLARPDANRGKLMRLIGGVQGA